MSSNKFSSEQNVLFSGSGVSRFRPNSRSAPIGPSSLALGPSRFAQSSAPAQNRFSIQRNFPSDDARGVSRSASELDVSSVDSAGERDSSYMSDGSLQQVFNAVEMIKSYSITRQETNKQKKESKKLYRSRVRVLTDTNDKQKEELEQLQDSVRVAEEKVREQEQLYLETLDDCSIKEKRLGEMSVQVQLLEERAEEELQLKWVEIATKDEKFGQAQRDIENIRRKLKAEVDKAVLLHTNLDDEKAKLTSLQRMWSSKLNEAEERHETLEGELTEVNAKVEEKTMLMQERDTEMHNIQQELVQIQEVCSTLELTRDGLRGELMRAEKKHADNSGIIAKIESDVVNSVERNTALVSELARAGHELEIAKSKLVDERQAGLSTKRAILANLSEMVLPVRRTFESMQTMQRTFNDCRVQAESRFNCLKTELMSKDEESSELIKVAHDTSMALTKYKNSCTDALQKADDVAKERDELSKSVASLSASEEEKTRLADQLRKVEKELKDRLGREAERYSAMESTIEERDKAANAVEELQKKVEEAVKTRKESDRLMKTMAALRLQLQDEKNAYAAALQENKAVRTKVSTKTTVPAGRAESGKASGSRGKKKTRISEIEPSQISSPEIGQPSENRSSKDAQDSRSATRSRSGGNNTGTKSAKLSENDSPSQRSSSSSGNYDLFDEDNI